MQPLRPSLPRLFSGPFPKGIPVDSILRTLIGGAYGLSWTAARPLLRRHKRLRDGFDSRLVPSGWPADPGDSRPLRTDIWLQAASGGEAYLVWELLRHFATLHGPGKDMRVLATTWTKQGLETLQKMRAMLEAEHPWLEIRTAYFPLDAPEIMRRAVAQARPRVVGLLETELWPGLMLACRKQNVPMIILNGRMTEKSLRNYLRLEAAGFWSAMPPEHVCAISQADAERFARLFDARRVEVVPNIKFDRAAAAGSISVSGELLRLLPREAHAGRTVLLASVREQEEPELLATIRALREENPTVIIAPRHMHRVPAWQKLLEGKGVLREGRTAPFDAGSLVIWNTFGELGQLYQCADAVFVGGSLAPLGGQNILEPLALGRVPCTGPYLDNFAWALEPCGGHDSLEALGLLRRGSDGGGIAGLLRDQLALPEAADAVRGRFRNWLAPRLGGSERCAGRLLELLDRTG